MNHRDGKKRVAAYRETFPAHDQAAVFALDPGKRPFGLEARDGVLDRMPVQLCGLPHPCEKLGADPASATALAKIFGIISFSRRHHFDPLARSAPFTRADAEGVRQREDLGALVPIGWGRACGQRHTSGIHEAMAEDALAFPAIGKTLTAAFASGKKSHPRSRTATELAHVRR
jgi:hypothetical protein